MLYTNPIVKYNNNNNTINLNNGSIGILLYLYFLKKYNRLIIIIYQFI